MQIFVRKAFLSPTTASTQQRWSTLCKVKLLNTIITLFYGAFAIRGLVGGALRYCHTFQLDPFLVLANKTFLPASDPAGIRWSRPLYLWSWDEGTAYIVQFKIQTNFSNANAPQEEPCIHKHIRYIHTPDTPHTHTFIHIYYIQSNFSMDETPTQVISKMEVDNILQSWGDLVATITAQGKLVSSRLFQQNTILVVAQLAELKSAGVTKESPCVSNVTIMEHEINILNAQLKVMYMKLGNERESAKQERISKMKVISLLKGRIKKMADKQIPRSPPTKHMSWQPFQQENRNLQEAGPFGSNLQSSWPCKLECSYPHET